MLDDLSSEYQMNMFASNFILNGIFANGKDIWMDNMVILGQ